MNNIEYQNQFKSELIDRQLRQGMCFCQNQQNSTNLYLGPNEVFFNHTKNKAFRLIVDRSRDAISVKPSHKIFNQNTLLI